MLRGRLAAGVAAPRLNLSPPSPSPPAGKFNPYAEPEVHALRAGKKSAVHVRSGNRSMTFRD